MIEPNPQYFTNDKEDEGIRVFFFEEPVLNNFKSEQLGVKIWEPQVFIKKFVPGNVDNPGARKATPAEIEKWHVEYEMFEKKRTVATSGFLLEHWARLSRTDVYALKAANIFTVEEFAGLADGQIQSLSIVGARTLQKEARDFLETSTKIKETADLIRKEEEMRKERDELRVEIEQLKNAVAQMTPKKKPGRKQKIIPNGVLTEEKQLQEILTDGTQ